MNEPIDTQKEIAGATISLLIKRCIGYLQNELDAVALKYSPADAVFIIMDGTSPLAHALPDVPPNLIKQGANEVAARLISRSSAVAAAAKTDKTLPGLIATPAACGHFQCIASNAHGFWVRCLRCDLGLTPKVRGS